MSRQSGTLVTVDGPIDPDDLGVTLPHEHVFADWVDAWYVSPESAYERSIARGSIDLETLWYVRRKPQQHEENLRLDSFDEAVDELARFHRAGGDAVVDVTPKNCGGDPARVRAVGRQTGLTMVHGTAYYTYATHPPALARRSIDDIADEFVDDVRNGIDGTSIRAGLVGEIGLSGHIHDEEERVLRAGARAAARTGTALSVHPPGRTPYSQRDRTYPTSRWCLEILDIIEEEGLPPERVVLCHMDRSSYEQLRYQKRLADRGAFIEYDLWGMEVYLDRHDDAYPADRWRVEAVTELIDEGYGSNLLFSHDVYLKIQRTAYGGFGYAHLLNGVVDRLAAEGVSSEQLSQIIRENPRRALTVVDPI